MKSFQRRKILNIINAGSKIAKNCEQSRCWSSDTDEIFGDVVGRNECDYGQKAVPTKARKAVSNFKLRIGMNIG